MSKFMDLLKNVHFIFGIIFLLIAGLMLWGIIAFASRAKSRDNNNPSYDTTAYVKDICGALFCAAMFTLTLRYSINSIQDAIKEVY
jgi:hypothetical protein